MHIPVLTVYGLENHVPWRSLFHSFIFKMLSGTGLISGVNLIHLLNIVEIALKINPPDVLTLHLELFHKGNNYLQARKFGEHQTVSNAINSCKCRTDYNLYSSFRRLRKHWISMNVESDYATEVFARVLSLYQSPGVASEDFHCERLNLLYSEPPLTRRRLSWVCRRLPFDLDR